MPFAIMSLAPSKVSSAGWNMSLTVPCRLASFSLSIFAAVSSMAAWKSWPQVCASVPVGQAKGSPLSSGMGSASMSARSRMTLPPCPMVALTPWPQGWQAMPSARSVSRT